MDKVYIVESGEYEQRMTWGVYSSVENAAAAIKDPYGPPYIVRWAEPRQDAEDSYVLVGHFERVDGYSGAGPGEWYITGYVVDPPPEV